MNEGINKPSQLIQEIRDELWDYLSKTSDRYNPKDAESTFFSVDDLRKFFINNTQKVGKDKSILLCDELKIPEKEILKKP